MTFLAQAAATGAKLDCLQGRDRDEPMKTLGGHFFPIPRGTTIFGRCWKAWWSVGALALGLPGGCVSFSELELS